MKILYDINRLLFNLAVNRYDLSFIRSSYATLGSVFTSTTSVCFCVNGESGLSCILQVVRTIAEC